MALAGGWRTAKARARRAERCGDGDRGRCVDAEAGWRLHTVVARALRAARPNGGVARYARGPPSASRALRGRTARTEVR